MSNKDLIEALDKISRMATNCYENSRKLRSADARTVRRIADIADNAIEKENN